MHMFSKEIEKTVRFSGCVSHILSHILKNVIIEEKLKSCGNNLRRTRVLCRMLKKM